MSKPAEASAPYLGSSCISIKGDFPGLSKRCFGTIGSYQYNTDLPLSSCTTPAGATDLIAIFIDALEVAVCIGVCACCQAMPAPALAAAMAIAPKIIGKFFMVSYLLLCI